jgi:hypothetical protein
MHLTKRIILILLASTAFIKTINAQDVIVTAKFDTSLVTIGDTQWLELSVVQKKGDLVRFPQLRDTLVKNIDILEYLPQDTQRIDNQNIRINQKYLVGAYEPGFFILSPLPFQYTDKILYTDSLFLFVAPVQLDSIEIARIDTNQVFHIFDIKEPINTPWTIKEFLQLYYPYLIGFLVLAILVAGIVLYLKKRPKNTPLIKLPEKPKEPAHVIALRELEALKAKKLWQSGYVKEYYLDLSDIMRAYIENRFSIHTFERTTHELLELLSFQKVIDAHNFGELFNILSLSDLAKFAKYTPLPNENDLCLKNAFQFVENTKLEIKQTEEKPEEENKNAEDVVNGKDIVKA